jgi:hypothetical protein
MNQDQVTGIIRHLGTLLGGVLLARGNFDAATIQSVVGAIATIGGLAWSVMSKLPAPTPPTTQVTQATPIRPSQAS